MISKFVKLVAIVALIAGVAGIASAIVDDQLMATWTGTEIRAEAWNLMSMWYEIRFYAPGVLPDPFDNSIVETHNDPADPQYPFSVGPKFAGSTCTESNHCVRTFTPGVTGDWIVVLMKDGNEDNQNPTVQNSHRVNVSVNVPIPEFSTIAMPIAAILGLVYFFQSRKKK